VDIRIIAATNKDLHEQIQKNQFRKDLFYRLNVIPIHVAPLNERKQDIKYLVEYFIQKYSEKYNKNIKRAADDTMDAILRYHWPGNIRELKNTIESASVIAENGYIDIVNSLFFSMNV